MPKFISDAEMAELDPPKKKGFISDAEMASMETPDEPPPTVGESALRGGAQGVFMDWADEGEAALRTAGDVLQGSTEWNSPGERYGHHLKKSRAAFKRAEQENPGVYGASQLAGGIGSALALPGVGAGAGLAKVAGAGLLQGTVTGAGASEAEDLKGVAQDAGVSGGLGMLGSGLVHGAVKGVKAGAKAVGNTDMYKWLADKSKRVASKGASLLAGVPEESLARYKSAPDAVNAARPYVELGDEGLRQLETLKKKAVSGSHAAGDALPKKTIAVGEIQDRIDELSAEAGGRYGKRQAAATKELQYWRDELNRATKRQHVPLSELNKIRKDLGIDLDQARKAGTFGTPKNQAKEALRNKIRASLGAESDAFDKKMIEVADDFDTLGRASSVFGAERSAESAIKRAAGKNAAKDAELLEELGQRSGGGSLLREAKDYGIQQGFEGSAGGGFTGRRTMAGAAGGMGLETGRQLLSDEEFDPYKIAAAASGGGMLGAASDRYAPLMAKGVMDLSRSKPAQMTREGVQRFIDAAKRRGPDAARAAQYMILKEFPQFREMFEDK